MLPTQQFMQASPQNLFSYQMYALHGFLGQPSDWQTVFEGCSLQYPVKAWNLFEDHPIQPFDVWTPQIAEKLIDKSDPSRVLIGYSLGGRLALHLALHSPSDWDAVVIVSAHLGLPTVDAQQARCAQDEVWAKRFEETPWKTLMDEWNDRAVFQNDSFAFERKESEYRRSALAQALRCWSLGNQRDLSHELPKMPCPVLWIAGEEDGSYAEQAKKIQQQKLLQHPHSKVWLAPNSGHRVPWQRTEEFIQELKSFLRNLNPRVYNDTNNSY